MTVVPIPGVKLSTRQLECLARIAAGETSVEIAAGLGLSPRTVDHYVGAACQKLGARSRAQAVAAALQMDLIASPPGSSARAEASAIG